MKRIPMRKFLKFCKYIEFFLPFFDNLFEKRKNIWYNETEYSREFKKFFEFLREEYYTI